MSASDLADGRLSVSLTLRSAAKRNRRITARAVLLALAITVLMPGSPANAHSGGRVTTRFQAKMQVRQILWDNGWFVTRLRCGSPTWTVGIHFPCTFRRFGSDYIACYHSLDYDYGVLTQYRRWSCRKWY